MTAFMLADASTEGAQLLAMGGPGTYPPISIPPEIELCAATIWMKSLKVLSSSVLEPVNPRGLFF